MALTPANTKFDLIVIGGGSGGLACVKEAAVLGAKCAVLDFVTPSPAGTAWGLGGTCVNVGCIPKKLCHQASLIGETFKDSGHYGWQLAGPPKHDWESLIMSVQGHVKSLNWGHRVALRQKTVEYFNGRGVFTDTKTIEMTKRNGEKQTLEADNFVIAVGGRPKYPEIPGCPELCISSDDIFALSKAPGKTMVIGASYVALECAGFLTGLGYNSTVMMRSIPLRGFDQQMAALLVGYMKETGTKFVEKCVPVSIKKVKTGLEVTWKSTEKECEVCSEIFDTVLMAVGRSPETSTIGLQKIGVKLSESSGKIIGSKDDAEQSSVKHIYAIGDCLEGGVELTPVAIHAGKLLAHRLFDKQAQCSAAYKMDYKMVATTIFTPLEYGCVGYSEEEAISKYTAEKLEIYHAFYKPLEFNLSDKPSEFCYIKAVCIRESPQTIIGLHITGPSAGEITMGFGAAMKCGLTYEKLKTTVGIHPTCAEEITKLNITKRSGIDPTVTGC